jgi:hypothetical protein
LHANVRGFQIAGMNHAPKLSSASSVTSMQGELRMMNAKSQCRELETIRMLFELDRDDDPRNCTTTLIRFKKGTKRINRLRLLAHEAVLGQFNLPAVAATRMVPSPSFADSAGAAPSGTAFDLPVAADVFDVPIEK